MRVEEYSEFDRERIAELEEELAAANKYAEALNAEVQTLRPMAPLLERALAELASIEAITVSPAGCDELMLLCNEMAEALGRLPPFSTPEEPDADESLVPFVGLW